MFDTIKMIFLGFSGALKDTRESRKLVWALLITFLAGWLAAGFAAWVSYPSYRGLVDFLPYAGEVSAAFTGGIAGFLYFSLAYLAGYLVEKWKDSPFRSYSALGARIFLVCSALFLVIDVYMNLTGATYRADEAAGEVVEMATYQTAPEIRADRDKAQAALDKLTGGQLGGYGWPDPDGKFRLNDSGKRYQRELTAQIRRAEIADSTQRAAFLADASAANERRAATFSRAEKTLQGAVYGVYILVFLLAVAQAYMVETIQIETGRAARTGAVEASTGDEREKTAQHTKPEKEGRKTAQNAPAPGDLGTRQAPLVVAGKGYPITCKHCGETAVMKSPRAQYCGEECRRAAWEARTGAKIKNGKKPVKPGKIGF